MATRLLLPVLAVLVAAAALVAALPAHPPATELVGGAQGMAHAGDPRPQVLDAGDLALLEPFPAHGHLRPALGPAPAPVVAGDRGDVVPAPVANGTLLHRVLVYVVYVPATRSYDVPALNLTNVTSFTLPNVGHLDAATGGYVHGPLEVRLDPTRAGHASGYVTKGDRWGLADQDARQDHPARLLAAADVHQRVTAVVDAQGLFAQGMLALALASLAAVAGPTLVRRLNRVAAGLRCRECESLLAGHEPFCPRCGHRSD